ncbi:MAG: metallophosphoesterase family protein [Kiritimatiellaeota bacterium]|nr:metallophosphoesterase family protein [Kiritimatiellota bacterium]
MRYAIVSDIHGNLQAWNAALTDSAAMRADRIVCLGDCVGYGPEPAAVLASLHRHVHAFVLGNHDAVVCGKMSADVFNDAAQRLIAWTQKQLGASARDFLGTLPLELVGDGFRCTHGSFDNPAAFDYVTDAEEARRSLDATTEPLLFVGHSHIPALFVVGESGTVHALPPQDFTVEPGKRYLVNVGSVGSPRDGGALASYLLYDTATQSLFFRRIPFDLDAFRETVLMHGLSPDAIPLLHHDPRKRLVPVREALDFTPAQTPEQEARHVIRSASVEDALRRRVALWKWIAGIVVAVAMAVTLTVYAILARQGRRQLAQAEENAAQERHALLEQAEQDALQERQALLAQAEQGTLRPVTHPADTRIIAMPQEGNALPAFPATVDDDGGILPWGIHYGDTKTQSAHLDNGTLRIIDTGNGTPWRIETPAIALGPMRRLTLTGEYAAADGSARFTVAILNGATQKWDDHYRTVDFRSRPGRDGKSAQETFDLPKAATHARIILEGRGAVSLRNLSLAPRPPK